MRLVNSGSMILTIIFWVLFKKFTLVSLLWINFITNMITNGIGFMFGMAKLGTIASRTKTQVKEIYNFGIYSLGTNLVSNLLRNTDMYILKIMLGPAAVANYNIPVKLLEIVEIPLRSFVGTGMSGMSAAYNTNNMGRVKYIFTKYAGMLTMAFIPLAFVAYFFADFAVGLASSSKFMGSKATLIFQALMFLAILYPLDRFNGATLDVIHKPKINFYKVIVMLVVNVIADCAGLYFFNDLYGILLGCIGTTLAGLVYGYFQLNKYVPYSILEVLKTGFGETKQLVQGKLRKGNV